MSNATNCHSIKGVCYSNLELCTFQRLSGVRLLTVTLRCNSLKKGVIDPKEAEEKGCTYTFMKKQNKNYYTSDIGARKLNDLLSNHHKANGEGIHKPVGDILQIES